MKIFTALHNFRRPLISRSSLEWKVPILLSWLGCWPERVERDFRGEHFILHSGATKVQNIGNYAMKPWEFCLCNSKINVSNLLPNDPSNCLPSSHTQDRKVPMVLNLVVFLQTHRGYNIQERHCRRHECSTDESIMLCICAYLACLEEGSNIKVVLHLHVFLLVNIHVPIASGRVEDFSSAYALKLLWLSAWAVENPFLPR